MFCFAWGLPWELLKYYGNDLLDTPWPDIDTVLHSRAKSRFWENPGEVYDRFLLTIQGRHFSPFTQDNDGLFESFVHENDPPDYPVYVMRFEPGFRKYCSNESKNKNPITKELCYFMATVLEECDRLLPTFTEPGIPGWKDLQRLRDPVREIKFTLWKYRENNNKIAQGKVKEAIEDMFKQTGLKVNSRKFHPIQAERMSGVLYRNDPEDEHEVSVLNEEKLFFPPQGVSLKNQEKEDIKRIEELVRAYQGIRYRKAMFFSFAWNPCLY